MSKAPIKNIIYVGNDSEFDRELNTCVEKYVQPPFHYESINYKKDIIVKKCFKELRHIIFVDFTNLEMHSVNSLLEEVLFLKSTNKYRSILFCSIIENALEANKLLKLHSQGFQLSFIKGQDETSFFMDAYRMAIDDDYTMPRFAKAKDILKPLIISCCSSLRGIDKKSFVIETDLYFNQDYLDLNLKIFPDLKLKQFKIHEHIESGFRGIGFQTYTLELPFAGPWDEVTEENLQQDTVETWLENNNSLFKEIRSSFFIFNTQENNLEATIYASPLKNEFEYIIYDDFDDQQLLADLKLRLPSLIFFEFLDFQKNNKKEATNALEEIINLITQISSYRPIIILGSCPSSTIAVRKTYQYEKLLASHEKITWPLVTQFSEKFRDQQISCPLHKDYSILDETSQISFLEVFLEVEVVSLTEHEISFTTPVEIPFYTVLKMSIPIQALITVIPAPFELESFSHTKHYLGIIHGASETEQNKIRIFINQIIYKSLDSFHPDEVDRIIAQKELKDEPEKNKSQIDDATADKDHELSKQTKLYKKSKIKGRSKL